MQVNLLLFLFFAGFVIVFFFFASFFFAAGFLIILKILVVHKFLVFPTNRNVFLSKNVKKLKNAMTCKNERFDTGSKKWKMWAKKTWKYNQKYSQKDMKNPARKILKILVGCTCFLLLIFLSLLYLLFTFLIVEDLPEWNWACPDL